jgi:DNA replication and repair protein RecF
MRLDELRLHQFRNIANATLGDLRASVFLIGENGQGKTNLLEAIYLLCSGGSFRTRVDHDLVANGADAAAVNGRFDDDGVASQVGVSIHRASGKLLSLDGSRVRDRMQLIERAPCIAFSHGDLEFVDGGPDRRRWYFNQTQALLDPLFIETHRRYRRVLRARNTLLRAGAIEQVPLYDHQLVTAGRQIQNLRAQLAMQLSSVIEELFAAVASISAVTVRYRPSWLDGADAEELEQRLASHLRHDLQMKTTTSGPHRDEFVLMLGDARFSAQGSTGQRRLAALILRVAQGRFFEQQTGRKPLLLLDDVLLELDADKRSLLVANLPSSAQTFFTFLPDETHERYSVADTMVFRVHAGQFVPQ